MFFFVVVRFPFHKAAAFWPFDCLSCSGDHKLGEIAIFSAAVLDKLHFFLDVIYPKGYLIFNIPYSSEWV